MQELSLKTGCGYAPVKPKSPYRASEKIGFAFSTVSTGVWDASAVKDVVRGAKVMPDVAKGLMLLELLIACDVNEAVLSKSRGWDAVGAGLTASIVILGVKNRWKKPTSGGWSDAMIIFTFVGDPTSHICEVQLVHTDMMRVRTKMNAHKGYGAFRCALALSPLLAKLHFGEPFDWSVAIPP
jgi:hypothetical protein